MKSITIFILSLFIISGFSSFAQTNNDSIDDESIIDTVELKDKNFQLSLIYPLSTNGGKIEYVNKLSINLIAGYQAGLRGTELGLFGNINEYFSEGKQIAGLFNSTGNLYGTQFAFILNNAKNVEGNQIGFINICDSLGGKQYGFINVVDTSYKKFELWANEMFQLNMGIKLGRKEFYKILAVGNQPIYNKFRIGYGIGVGTEKDLKDGKNLNLDYILYHVNENSIFTKKLNLLNHFRANIITAGNGSARFYYGVGLNIYISNVLYNGDDDRLGPEVTPFRMLDLNNNIDIIKNNKPLEKPNIQMWPGITLGIQL